MNLKYRPFAVMGFVALASLIACIFVTEKLCVILIATGFITMVVSLLFKQIRTKAVPFYISVALMFSGLMFTAINEYDLKYARRFIDKNAEIVGVIIDEPQYRYSRYYYIMDLESVDGNKLDCKLRLSLPNAISAEPYDKVRLNAKIYEIASDSKEIQLYYQSKGIFLGAYEFNSDDSEIEIIKRENNSFSYQILLMQNKIRTSILDKLPNENGAAIIALLLGDKTELSDELNNKFREAGVAPLFAVSGLHLSVWVMGLYSLLSQVGIRKRSNSVICIIFTLFFMILTGLTASVCRSGVMMLLLLVGNLFYRKTDSVNSLGFAAFILCAINPYIAADSGFLMSFCATLGIVTLMPLVDKYIFCKIPKNTVLKPIKVFLNIIFVSITASIGVFPVTVFFVGYFSLFGVVTNVLVTYAATLCMILGGLIPVTSCLGFFSDFLSLIAGLLARYLIWIVEIICSLPVTTVSTEDIFWRIGVILSVGVVIISLLCFEKKALIRALAVGMSFVIMICSVSSYLYYDELTQLRILNTGNGVCVVVHKNGQKLVLSGKADGYYKVNEIADSLNSINRKPVDLFLIGDFDGAEDSDNLELIKKLDIREIITPVTSQTLERLVENVNVSEKSNVLIEVWDNGAVLYYCCEDYSLAHCTFEETSILVLFSSKKYINIDEKFLKADYLVCSGYIPNCIKPEAYDRVVLCGTAKIEEPIYNYVISCGGNPLKVYEFESIRINIRKESEKILVMEG